MGSVSPDSLQIGTDGGGARLVQQPQFVKDANRETRMGFIRKVYGILTAQLLLTVAIAGPFQSMSIAWMQSHLWIMWLSCGMSLITIIAISCCDGMARKFPTNYIMLFTFTIFEAILLGFLSACYTKGSVVMCAGITMLIFAGLTGYAWKTKTDFTGLGPYLFGVLLSFVVFGLVMSIMASFTEIPDWLTMLYDMGGILLFVLYIIFDTQMIMGDLGEVQHKFQFSIDDYVFASLNLYLDIVNLFIHILRLFGQRR